MNATKMLVRRRCAVVTLLLMLVASIASQLTEADTECAYGRGGDVAALLSQGVPTSIAAASDISRLSLPLIPDLAVPEAAQTGVQDKTVSVFGQNIHYLEAGTGPTVILLHGLGGNAGNWTPTIPVLAAKYHVIVPDQIGFGRSDKPLIPYRIGTYIDFLDKLCAELKIDKATVVGNSLGGWIAGGFALRYPQRVEKLILVDAAGFALPKTLDPNLLTGLNPVTREQIRAIISLTVYNKGFFLNDSSVDLGLTGRIGAGDSYTIEQVTASLTRGEDVLDGKLGGIKIPTLIVWGREDGLLTLADYGERFQREIPGAQLLVLEKCGHVPQLEKAAEFNAAVLKFLAP